MQALIALCFKSLMEVISHAIGVYTAMPDKQAAPDTKVYLLGPANVPSSDDLNAKYSRL